MIRQTRIHVKFSLSYVVNWLLICSKKCGHKYVSTLYSWIQHMVESLQVVEGWHM